MRIVPFRYTLVGWYDLTGRINTHDPDVMRDRFEEERSDDAESELQDAAERLLKREKANAAKEAKKAGK